MNCSPEINELATALAKAQCSFKPLKKDREVDTGKYKFKYATLDAVREATNEGLGANGLAIVQPPSNGEHGIVVTTRLLHSSGQWIEESLEFEATSAAPQQLGSLISYARRYLLCGMLGVTADEDDDGNKGNANTVAPLARKPAAKTNGVPPKKTPAQMNQELGDHFGPAEAIDPSVTLMNKARVGIENAQNGDRLDKAEQWAEAACGNGEISQEQHDELKTLVMKRRKELSGAATRFTQQFDDNGLPINEPAAAT